mmetsp:Transcript_34145/g.89816  ORF Transcript_34145/g.89816 Transcript_34145/m.89816 type:complete len:267 (+) Transcript_34145:731-1531(+)
MWEHVCSKLGTNPLRTPEDARQRPERNAYLLACLLLHAFTICKPKDPTRHFVRPRSALAYPLAICRIFRRWGVETPSYKMLVSELHGMSRLYLEYHGPHSLAPHRAEPMQFKMVRRMLEVRDTTVGQHRWDDSVHVIFTFRRLIAVMMVTGFRLAEIVKHTSGEIMYLTFGCLTWVIDGVPSTTRQTTRQLHCATSSSAPPSTGQHENGTLCSATLPVNRILTLSSTRCCAMCSPTCTAPQQQAYTASTPSGPDWHWQSGVPPPPM